jgi:hypothetical protein
MTPEKEIICIKCTQFGGAICPAFPDGIPENILSGKNKHRKPLPGQKNNIVFEPITK